MTPEYFCSLYDYNYWARDRLLAAMEGMSDSDYAAPNGFVYGSIRGILVHTLAAEVIWLSRWQGVSPDRLLTGDDIPRLSGLHARWAEEEAKMRAFVWSRSEEDLKRTVLYRSTSGNPYSNPLWELMAHVLNHSTQHRSEAAEALTRIGRSPGDLDLIDFFREAGR